MRRAMLLLGLAASFAALGAAAADENQTGVPALLFGVEPTTPAGEVAVIYMNQAHEKNVKTLIGAIFPLAEGKSFNRDQQQGRENVRKVGMAYIKPGRYYVSGHCALASRDVAVGTELMLEAGKIYHLRCKGRTPRSLEYEALELQRAP